MYIEGKKTKDRLVLVPDVPQNERKKELELVQLTLFTIYRMS